MVFQTILSRSISPGKAVCMTSVTLYYLQYYFLIPDIVIVHLNVNRRKKAGPVVRTRYVFRHFEFFTISIYDIKNKIPFENLEEASAVCFNGRFVDPS